MIEQLQLPELPLYMTHVEGGQPVVFRFIEKEPETAILPVYIMKKDESELMPTATFLKSSGSGKRELERPRAKSSKLGIVRSLSAKKASTIISNLLSSASKTGKSTTGKSTVQTTTEDSSTGKKSETIDEGCFIFIFIFYSLIFENIIVVI